jgi:hypothetical protein
MMLAESWAETMPLKAMLADDYIRLSYATSLANIQTGPDRIGRFCKMLVKQAGSQPFQWAQVSF